MLQQPTAPKSVRSRSFPQPLDRVAIAVVLGLSLLIGALILSGDHASPKVREFSWSDQPIGVEDTAFIFTFSHPMDRRSVEENLQIQPDLPGKFSWAGRRMAYTLEEPAPYGQSFEIRLAGARDRFSESQEDGLTIQPFEAQFRSRDRAFVYLGVTGEEAGRLILYNLTRQDSQVLTPPHLSVIDYEPYPQGDRILFSAIERDAADTGFLKQKLYTVATGLNPQVDRTGLKRWLPFLRREPAASGTIELVLDSDQYQNLKFDLAPDGKTIVVQRVNRDRPSDFGPWIIREDAEPERIKTDPGGDFLITPDSGSLVLAQGEGLAILPLKADTEPLDFLPKFGVVLNFARDGSAAAMVKFNTDYTRSLYLVTNQGNETELLRTEGSILNVQFDPTQQVLYCLVTQLLPGEGYVEQPRLVAINLDTQTRTDLLLLPIQRDIQMSLAPDGLGLLFDQTIAADPNVPMDVTQPQTSDGRMIADARLWFLPVTVPKNGKIKVAEPEPLSVAGLRPRWLP